VKKRGAKISFSLGNPYLKFFNTSMRFADKRRRRRLDDLGQLTWLENANQSLRTFCRKRYNNFFRLSDLWLFVSHGSNAQLEAADVDGGQVVERIGLAGFATDGR